MQKYKITMSWKGGFKHSYFHHGSDKSVLREIIFLDSLKYLSKYVIKEVNFKGW